MVMMLANLIYHSYKTYLQISVTRLFAVEIREDYELKLHHQVVDL